MDKKLINDLKNAKEYDEIGHIVFKYYPNWKNDTSIKLIKKDLENNCFNLLKIRIKLIDHYSIYSDIAVKTAHEIHMKNISPILFEKYFQANWINAILMDNIAFLIAMPNLPTITLKSLDDYILKLKGEI